VDKKTFMHGTEYPLPSIVPFSDPSHTLFHKMRLFKQISTLHTEQSLHIFGFIVTGHTSTIHESRDGFLPILYGLLHMF